MPISSAEIAQLAMANHQQFAAMRSSFNHADQAAGYAMNTASEMGSMGATALNAMPLGMAATAGIGAGISAFGSGAGAAGIAGAAGMAALPWAAAALPVMAATSAASYMGHQMMEGAGQQQRLNATLASSFGFQNQTGRRGFGRGDVSQIGASMREMAGEVGQGGELTSMKELTDLAGKMGQMGMGKGVRDAQEFNTKFREMIKTVKSVATEMNTSLSAAMEFMQASKSSGMFQQADQLKFARQVQSTAASSGLATSEVSAMGNIGSQISRAYGGLGKQGAMGGMKAIGQVGGALQAGAISEEDIYNATGQTGAEGRQALATNMMSKTGEFLKSGKGRWFMASMAGENGSINEGDAQRYMLGNLGTGDTRQMAGKNLNAVGRASFIRNEGRMRGAVMEKFGAMAPAMALSGWASQRGIDINNMDDRSMLFAQRQLGMGRDEMDVAVKMAQDMPRIMQQQNQQGDLAKYSKSLGMDQKNRGAEGMKRRFEHAKEKLNAGLQQAGADMYSDLTNTVDRWLDNWVGQAIPAATENLSSIFRESIRGSSSSSTSRYEAVFGGGKGGKAVGDIVSQAKGIKGGGFGAGGQEASRMNWQEFSGEGSTSNWLMGAGAGLAATGIGAAPGWGMMAAGGIMKAGSWLSGEGETAKRMRAGGYGSRIDEIGKLQGPDQQQALNKMMTEASAIQKAVTGNIGAIGVQGELRSTILKEYTTGAVGSAGLDSRGSEMQKILQREASKGDPRAGQLLEMYKGIKNPADKAAFIAGMEKDMGIDGGSNSLSVMGEKMGNLEGSLQERMKGKTQLDRDEALGGAMRGQERSGFWGSVGKGAAIGAGVGLAFGGIGAIPGALYGAAAGGINYYFGGGAKAVREDAALAKYARSEKGMQMLTGVASGDEASVEEARKLVARAGQDKVAGREPTPDEKAARDAAANALILHENKDLLRDPAKYSAEQKDAMFKDWQKMGGQGEDFEAMRGAVHATYVGVREQQETNRKRIAKELHAAGTSEADRMASMGIMEKDFTSPTEKFKLTAATEKELKSLKGQSMAAGMLQMEIMNAELAGDPDTVKDKSRQKHDMLGKMGVEELSKHVKASGDAEGAVMLSDAKRFKSLSRSKGGPAGAIAAFMGLGGGETKAERRDLQSAWGKGTDDYIKELTKQTGVGALGQNADFKKALEEARKGGKGSEVAVSSALDAAKASDPKIKEALEKRKESLASPQDKMVTQLTKLNDSMSKLTPAGIGEAMTTALTGAAPAIGAAMKGG